MCAGGVAIAPQEWSELRRPRDECCVRPNAIVNATSHARSELIAPGAKRTTQPLRRRALARDDDASAASLRPVRCRRDHGGNEPDVAKE